jgi:hypothetical protein
MIRLRPQGTARNNWIRPFTLAVPSNLGATLARPFGLSPRTKENGPVKSIRSKPLILVVLVISVVIAILSRLGHDGLGSLQTRQIEGFSAFGLNAAVAILGFWTPDRAASAAYLGVSVLAFFLLSVATPLNSLWNLMVVVFDWLSHG